MSTSNSSEDSPKEKVTIHALRILNKLDCIRPVREEAMKLIERADAQGLFTHGTPKGVAAGVVYIACILREDRMTLETIGSVVGLSGSAVSTNYMTLARSLGFGEQ